jgi:hypothetical protein
MSFSPPVTGPSSYDDKSVPKLTDQSRNHTDLITFVTGTDLISFGTGTDLISFGTGTDLISFGTGKYKHYLFSTIISPFQYSPLFQKNFTEHYIKEC